MRLRDLFANMSPDVRAANAHLFPDLDTEANQPPAVRWPAYVDLGGTDPLWNEREHQEALFAWAEAHVDEMPELALLYAVPNGQYRRGQRAEPGMKRGVPDMHLPVFRYPHLSLYVELKVGRNRLTADQRR